MENPININNSTRTSASNSPEFEFWTTQQPTDLHSADQLFSGGLILPLHQLNQDQKDTNKVKEPIINTPDDNHDQKDTKSLHSASQDSDKTNKSDLKTTPLTTSKRWKDIFKKNPEKLDKETKKKTREKNSGNGAGNVAGSTPELNINIWPFSRSRSAGNNGSRPRMVTGNRKVSSAPCSRSNSTGDKTRRWPSSPGRPGVHLGRSSPVWQAKRLGQSRSLHDNLLRNTAEKSQRPVNGKASTGVSVAKGMSCRSGVVAGKAVAPASVAGNEGGSTSMFSLRNLFTKKAVF